MEEATKLVKDIISGLAKDAAAFLVKKAKDYFVDLNYKDQIDVGDAYEVYLTRVYDTYSKSKSLVYISEERELASFFQPIDLDIEIEEKLNKTTQDREFSKYPRENSSQKKKKKKPKQKPSIKVSTENLSEVLSHGSKLLIMGSGGMGKTVLMKHFCINSMKTVSKIPVFISLRWFNVLPIEKDSFESLIYNQLTVFDFKLPYDYFLYSLEGDRYIFLFDGFDEISREKHALLSHKLSDFTRKYRNNLFIITSRQDERLVGLDEYKLCKISPLSFHQAKCLIKKLDIGHSVKNRFIKELEEGIYHKYESFISVPLLLSILFITYVENTTIPESLNEFYEEAFETLLYRHDRRKEGFERVLNSKLSYDKFRKVFIRFCFRTYFNEEYSFSENRLREWLTDSVKKLDMKIDVDDYINDLLFIVCMIIKDGRDYIFIHRSFQEYFAAYYVSQGTDQQQRALLFKLANINTENLRMTSDIYDKGKLWSFLDMLLSIEPKRLTYVILWPAVEKIYLSYTRNNEDLFKTAAETFCLLKNEKFETPYYSVSINMNENVFLSLGEFDLFLHYIFTDVKTRRIAKSYLDDFERNYMRLKNYQKYRDKNIIPILPSRYQPHTRLTDTKYNHEGLSLHMAYVHALAYVKVSIQLYHELLPQNKVVSSLVDILDNY